MDYQFSLDIYDSPRYVIVPYFPYNAALRLKHKPVEEKKTLCIVCTAQGINRLFLDQNLN